MNLKVKSNNPRKYTSLPVLFVVVFVCLFVGLFFVVVFFCMINDNNTNKKYVLQRA